MKQVDQSGTTAKQRGATLSERHAVSRGAKVEKSLGLSMVVHIALFGGAFAISFYAVGPVQPRRIYTLEVQGHGRAADLVLADDKDEVLAAQTVDPLELAPDLWREQWLDPEGFVPTTFLDPEPELVSLREPWIDEQLNSDFEGRDVESSPLGPIALVSEPAPIEPAPTEQQPDVGLSEPAPSPDEDADSSSSHTPSRIEGADPDYPRMSLRLKESGDVELRLTLDEEGRVRGVELANSSGVSRLDEAAMSAAPRWRFDLTPPLGYVDADVLRSFIHIVHFELSK